MSRYQKGIETKNRIFKAAKEIMQKYGYTNATIERIANRAEVPVSLVNYYYKKEELLVKIFREFATKTEAYIADTFPEAQESRLLSHLLFVNIYLRVIMEDSKSKDLFLEALQRELFQQERKEYSHKIALILESEHVKIENLPLERLIIAEYGAIRYILLYSYPKISGKLNEYTIDLFATIALRLAGIRDERLNLMRGKTQALIKDMPPFSLDIF